MIHFTFTKFSLLLLVVIGIAAFSRIFLLGEYPPALHADEVMNAYVGRYILSNGVDLYGNPWPLLYFDNFGDYPNVIPMYFSGAFTFLFGFNALATRLPIALMGLGGVLLIYFISREIFTNRSAALFAAFFVAIQPWHVVLSRSTAEGITASTVFLAAILLIFLGIKKSNTWLVTLAFVPLLLTYFLYPGFRVFTPIAMLPAFALAPNVKIRYSLIFMTIILFVCTLLISFTTWGTGRFNQTSALSKNSKAYVFQQEFTASLGSDKVLLARAMYNKPIMYGKQLLGNYLTYFSPEYLITSGGYPARYAIPNYGLLLVSTLFIAVLFLPTQILGRFRLNLEWVPAKYTSHGLAFFQWSIYILFVSVVPAALTIDDVPNVHRSIILSLMLAFPMGYLVARTSHWQIKKIPLWLLIGIVMTFEFLYFWISYTQQAPNYQSVFRHADSRKVIEEIIRDENLYNKVHVSIDPANALYYLFLKNDVSKKYSAEFAGGLAIGSINNIEFFKGSCPEQLFLNSVKKNEVIIIHEACIPNLDVTQMKKIKTAFHHTWMEVSDGLENT